MIPITVLFKRATLASLLVAVGACSLLQPKTPAPPTPSPDAGLILPNEHLKAEGIPPIPKALAERVGQYTEFKPASVVAWHPTKRALLLAYRLGATAQLHLLEQPMGTLEPLTEFPDPVRSASFEPKRGDYLVYARDTGGNEASQLYRYDIATKQSTLLTDPKEKHERGPWNRAGTALLLMSTQVDKTAEGGKREQVTTDLLILDPLEPNVKQKIVSLPGGGWGGFQWGPGDRVLYGQEYRSITDSTIWKIDIDTGKRTKILPTAKQKKAVAYGDVHLTRDGKRLVYTSDEDGEFKQMMVMDLASGQRRVLTRDVPWDVDAIVMRNEDGGDAALRTNSRRELALAVINIAGRRAVRAYDLSTDREIPLPELPVALQGGSVASIRISPNRDRDEVAFSVSSAQSPGDVYTLDFTAKTTQPNQQWTRERVPGIDTATFRETQIVNWKSFDGRMISGLITRPPARFVGKRPVYVAIHGGPEGQATIGFLGRSNYIINELGIAMIQPNVRGSSGYGKTFVSLDDGMKREDSVKDIGALLDWIATQPDLDPTRVMVSGGSYGGYMSLAVATTYSDRIAGSIDVVGISNFTSFLERTETYRRDLRRVEYGDERIPAMRAFFERIAPLNKAANIKKPLFVVQGLNDPRVPYQEADQIVAKARANGIPVWYLRADNEGHGFARKPNADFQFYAQLLFMQQFLLKPE